VTERQRGQSLPQPMGKLKSQELATLHRVQGPAQQL